VTKSLQVFSPPQIPLIEDIRDYVVLHSEDIKMFSKSNASNKGFEMIWAPY